MKRILGMLLLAGLLVMVTAAPASAHARLIGTDPAEDAVLPARPAAVVLTFDQTIQAVTDGVTLFAADRPPRPLPATAVGPTLQVPLPDDLGQGTFLVGWQVRSDDAHPISGVLEFSIGHRGPPPTGPQPTATDTAEPYRIVAQALAYLGLLVAIGLAVFDGVLASVPAAARVRRDTRLRHRLEWTGAAAAIAGTIGLAVVAGVTGAPIFTPLLVVLLVASGLALLLAVPDRGHRAGRILAGCGAVIAAASVLPIGHTRTKGPAWLMLPADLLHVLVGAIWLGGLIGLVIVLGSTRNERSDEPDAGPAATVLARFSVLAGTAVVLLAVTGTVQALLILPEPRALIDTGYGRTLLVKIGLTAVAAAIAFDNHFRLAPRVHATGAGTAGVRMLRRAAINEAAIIALAVVTAGVLVGLSPNLDDRSPRPGESGDRAREFTATLDTVTLQGRVEPGRVGGNAVEWTIVDAKGRTARLVETPRLRAIHRASGLGPIVGTTAPSAAGSYRSTLDLPLAGTWRFEFSARMSEFAEPVTEVEIEIAP
ncbi:copper resistance CopC/CopD family protein [Microlunatus speluncae]|uniref:copper resistance CopC/CopD family protein n=1 Tax=Microlunatus speluncae TaxID=2594267 RepID=UPI0012662C49|nr:copper resistance protein CopC [Microlunatus speluncae]